MNTNKNDLRYIKTDKTILDSFLSLLEEKSFENISVLDICAKANINRNTFYIHFKDKNDLLNQVIRASFAENETKICELIINHLKQLTTVKELVKLLYSILDVTKGKIHIYKTLFKNRALFDQACQMRLRFIHRVINTLPDVEERVIVYYIITGTFDVLMEWIIHEFCTLEKLAIILAKLIHSNSKLLVPKKES